MQQAPELLKQIEAEFPDVVQMKLSTLKNNARNAREHSEKQLTALMSSIQEWGWTIPAIISNDRTILAGHGRIEAARRLGLKQVGVVVVSEWDDIKQRAYMVADNQLALLSTWDFGALNSELDFLQTTDFDTGLLALSPTTKTSVMAEKLANVNIEPQGIAGSMAIKYGVSPFSVITVSDPWWIKERTLLSSHGVTQVDLCCLFDLMLRWYCPPGSGVLGVNSKELATVSTLLGYTGEAANFVFLDYISSKVPHINDLSKLVKQVAAPHSFIVAVLSGDHSAKELATLLKRTEALGLAYYNEIVVDGMGSGAGEYLQCRHVLVLVFVKGDPKKATELLGHVNMQDIPEIVVNDSPSINDPEAITPIEAAGGFWFKRDDYFAIGTARGGKVRSCLKLSEGAVGLSTAGSRASPQVNIVAQVAKHLGVPASAHLPKGELAPNVKETAHLIEIIQHTAGYNNTIKKRARDDAEARGWTEVPFGMECPVAIDCTKRQVRNIPDGVKRIVIPVGSGMSLCGLLAGMAEEHINLPVLGVIVGANPSAVMAKYAPPGWNDIVTLVKSEQDYHDYAPSSVFMGIQLDPIYEAKCIPFLEPGDMLWVVGIRSAL